MHTLLCETVGLRPCLWEHLGGGGHAVGVSGASALCDAAVGNRIAGEVLS